MALLEEICVVVLYEGVGLTLNKVSNDHVALGDRTSGEQHLIQPTQGNVKTAGSVGQEQV